ncbi:hypothetical protein FIBSPDRAFT_1045358 [Athelia psychrophila]|uniref:BTB domain-containing protein n=1 Tax=Athelia psychrophila TaxID=1759441 RepID=A0A167VEQ2_9AGAM|nr:hypothetical protein FIBSPDRAFT_1054371 [Fibularhizoctonia sp. CBS 109695]KZP19773.1 hypothetical protein FIBSPDRAFT_1045358 [Fibularhizoctonia sp. CBS 109695]
MSSDDQPAPKLKRDDTPEESTSHVAPVKSSIWYPDGNIILQAEGTQWRVHKSILAQSSSIFQDMFSIPQPPPIDTELVEDCPIVHLSDSAEEVEYVLQAICQREYVGLEEALPLPVISAFIRLGMKYDIHKLRIEGQKRIFNEFPDALACVETGVNGHWNPTWKFVRRPKHWFELVTFARTTGLLSILPFVLYTCCQRYSTFKIMGVSKQSDGTLISLSIQDQLACLAGFQGICKAQAETTFSWVYANSRPTNCTSEGCSLFRDAYLKFKFTPVPAIAGLETFKSEVRHGGLCSVCADHADEMQRKGREQFWLLLPSLFGLPPWEELCKERQEVA